MLQLKLLLTPTEEVAMKIDAAAVMGWQASIAWLSLLLLLLVPTR